MKKNETTVIVRKQNANNFFLLLETHLVFENHNGDSVDKTQNKYCS